MKTRKEIEKLAEELNGKKTNLQESITTMISKNFSKTMVEGSREELGRICQQLDTLIWVLDN